MRSFKNSRLAACAIPVRLAFILVIVLVTSVFSGCTLLPKEEEVLAPPIKEPQKVTYETIEVKKGTIERKIRCTGYFVSVSEKDLFFQYRGGRLNELYVKYGDKVKKGDVLAELDTETILNDIALQKLALERSQIAYDRIKTQSSIEGGGGKYDIDLARLDLEANKLKLDNLSSELAKSKLTAPIDGDIVYIKDIKLGEYLNAYDNLLTIADPTILQLQYSEEKVSDLRLGMKVDVEIDDKQYPGEIVSTPSEAPADADEVTKKSVRIKVNDLPDSVSIGSDASFSLTLEKRENVIVLPKQVVNSFTGRRFVNILNDGIREERDIELGIQTDTEVEVVKGIDVGELVIVR